MVVTRPQTESTTGTSPHKAPLAPPTPEYVRANEFGLRLLGRILLVRVPHCRGNNCSYRFNIRARFYACSVNMLLVALTPLLGLQRYMKMFCEKNGI